MLTAIFISIWLISLIVLLFYERTWLWLVAGISWLVGSFGYGEIWPLYFIGTAFWFGVFMIVRAIIQYRKRKKTQNPDANKGYDLPND